MIEITTSSSTSVKPWCGLERFIFAILDELASIRRRRVPTPARPDPRRAVHVRAAVAGAVGRPLLLVGIKRGAAVHARHRVPPALVVRVQRGRVGGGVD